MKVGETKTQYIRDGKRNPIGVIAMRRIDNEMIHCSVSSIGRKRMPFNRYLGRKIAVDRLNLNKFVPVKFRDDLTEYDQVRFAAEIVLGNPDSMRLSQIAKYALRRFINYKPEA